MDTPMSAKFLVSSTMSIQTRLFYVLVGSIIVGQIRKGMKIIAPQFPSGLIVEGVEFVDHVGRQVSEIGLTVKCRSQKELDSLLALELAGTEIDLIEFPFFVNGERK
jgi:hypothetical protein